MCLSNTNTHPSPIHAPGISLLCNNNKLCVTRRPTDQCHTSFALRHSQEIVMWLQLLTHTHSHVCRHVDVSRINELPVWVVSAMTREEAGVGGCPKEREIGWLDTHLGFYVIQICEVWLQSGSDWPKSGLFPIRFQYIFSPLARKSPGFVPYWANLTHFEAKPSIPAPYSHGHLAKLLTSPASLFLVRPPPSLSHYSSFPSLIHPRTSTPPLSNACPLLICCLTYPS